MTAEQPFRVLIAGGSVVGLQLANALEKAGIDFLVLEKGDIAPRLGASISVLCHSARVYEQLGIWKQIQACTVPLVGSRLHYDETGNLFEDSKALGIIAVKAKRPIVFMERHTYLDILYNNLKDKSKVQDHVAFVSYLEDEDGVTVTTDRGEEIRGDILVGADGIHSKIRQLVSDSNATKDINRGQAVKPDFVSSYRCIFGTSKNQRGGDTSKPFAADGTAHNVYYRDVSGVVAAGVSGLVFWFLYVKEDVPATNLNSPRYTEADAQATMDRYQYLNVAPNYTFGDLWEARVRAVMVPLEEGVVAGPWNNGGRVVLMGDAIAKSTVNPGLGGNTHLEGVCRFVNTLKSLLEEHSSPTTEQIRRVFDKYEEQQRPRAQLCVTVSGAVTRFEAMATWYWRLARVLSPWIPDGLKARGYLDFAARAPILNFLPDPDAST